MDNSASDIARRLAREAEAVCRHYLSTGRKQGQYWTAGDVDNTPGRSLYVRLTGPKSGHGAAGKWTDAATGEHGDLLDLIAANLRISTFADTLCEARRSLPITSQSCDSRTRFTAFMTLPMSIRQDMRPRTTLAPGPRAPGSRVAVSCHAWWISTTISVPTASTIFAHTFDCNLRRTTQQLSSMPERRERESMSRSFPSS